MEPMVGLIAVGSAGVVGGRSFEMLIRSCWAEFFVVWYTCWSYKPCDRDPLDRIGSA